MQGVSSAAKKVTAATPGLAGVHRISVGVSLFSDVPRRTLAAMRRFPLVARPASRRRLLGGVLAALAGELSRSGRPAAAAGSVPTGLAIPAIGVDAPVEVRTTVDGTMQNPTDAWIAAWYDDSAG